MLDEDLADLYNVETKALVRAVKRNIKRFPDDFMFQLDPDEWQALRCQIGTSKNQGKGGRRYPPFAFTEQGVAMLSGLLNSERAIAVNIEIMRTFARLRHMLASNKDLSEKLDKLERRCDKQFKIVFDAIRKLMYSPASKNNRKIGFRTDYAE